MQGNGSNCKFILNIFSKIGPAPLFLTFELTFLSFSAPENSSQGILFKKFKAGSKSALKSSWIRIRIEKNSWIRIRKK